MQLDITSFVLKEDSIDIGFQQVYETKKIYISLNELNNINDNYFIHN